MSDFIWWTIFSILTLLLVAFTAQLCHSVISEVCCEKKTHIPRTSDVEDLTRYQRDFRTVLKDIECKDETDKDSLANLLISSHHLDEKSEENEEVDSLRRTNELVEDTVIQVDEEDEEVANLTTGEKEVFDKIVQIESEVGGYAKLIPYCLGGKQHLQYFEMNQNFLMNRIRLSNIDCNDNEKLKKRKNLVSVYIQDCQNQLEKKVKEETEDQSKRSILRSQSVIDREVELGLQEIQELTEDEKKIYEGILGVKGEIDIYAQKIPHCDKMNLQFFEINQKFLLILIRLSNIDCKGNEKLKKRKQMVSSYIQDCQRELRKKAGESV